MNMPASEDTTQRLINAPEAARTLATDAGHAVNERAQAVADAVADGAKNLTDDAGATLDSVRSNVSDRAQQARDAVDEITASATRTVKRHPVRSLLIVAAIVAIASFIAGILTSRRT